MNLMIHQLTIETLYSLHVIWVSHCDDSSRTHRQDVFGMDETSRVIGAIHLMICESFAEEKLFLETFFLTLAIGEAYKLMFRINECRVRIMLVCTQIVKKLLIRTIHHHMTLVLDVLVVYLRHSKWIWIGIFVISTQYASTQRVFVQQIHETSASQIVPHRCLERQRSAFEGCFEQTSFDAFTSSQKFVDGQVAFADERTAGNAQQRPMSRFACKRYCEWMKRKTRILRVCYMLRTYLKRYKLQANVESYFLLTMGSS